MVHRKQILWFRNSAPYINAHRGRTFVLVLGGEAVQQPNFANIIHDIALLHSLGVRLILVHGSRPQIEERQRLAELHSKFHNGVRITDAAAMEHVIDAAGALRAQFEALLSMGLPNSPMQGAGIRVCSGNFVGAKPLGVVDGVDYDHTGKVRNIAATDIHQHLETGSIVLLSPLGYSRSGKIFNLSLHDIAVRTAAETGADKLILFGSHPGISSSSGELVRQCGMREALQLTQDVADTEQRMLLQAARQACTAGVKRCHIVSHLEDGALLEELFSHDGSGTLVANDDYERARAATIEDIGGILELIEPLEREGVLVKRSRELLEAELGYFRVLERDGRVIAVAALYPFPEHSAGEIACIVTHPDYQGNQRGQRLLSELEAEASRQGLTSVFVLTTQTGHWFMEQGFVESGQDSLPQSKQALYNLQRNSKVFCKSLLRD